STNLRDRAVKIAHDPALGADPREQAQHHDDVQDLLDLAVHRHIFVDRPKQYSNGYDGDNEYDHGPSSGGRQYADPVPSSKLTPFSHSSRKPFPSSVGVSYAV